MKKRPLIIVALLVVLAIIIGGYFVMNSEKASLSVADVQGTSPKLVEPKKQLFPTVNVAPAIGWKEGEAPTPAPGLTVKAFASGLDHPRWLLPLANGDVLVAESNAPPKPDDSNGIRGWAQRKLMGRAGAGVASANRITLLRDADGDGVAESRSVLLSGLNSPFGMALANGQLYVADTDKLLRFPFVPGQTKIDVPGVKLVDLPAGRRNHHWTKNVIASEDGSKLYVTVGSNSNVAEHGMEVEKGRAAIWEVDAKTGKHRIFAYGLRNPNGMAWNPDSKMLWTVVNERDEIGSDIVPDYLTSVQFGGFYGWPWYYWGGYVDKRVPADPDDLRQYVIRPDYALGPHTASLGLTFATGAKLGPQFASGAFIGQHGSWNRRPKSGYKVVYVPFVKGRPTGKPVDVLTGFLNAEEEARGRPVAVVVDRTGGLLVADDVGNKIWRVAAR
ncbi:sorbosone dehydrogenase [Sphingomonas oleivorans]|uniref:Sorbosone dehydrogenase n=1 Tax=Sphingomonas oleivorans TaxID=1735121 RepID=A0A2T5FY32_9SPHN|nr:sorbosone dehydrogenase family protein [Sphingomonas oleivorans]PTQ11439.1 sorbosone dehydrogenase [Sphingomonas oleivorans]